jgi:hypothetical protein
MDAQQAAERIYTLRQAIKQYEDEVETLAREHFAKRPVDTYVEGSFQVVVGRNARFDPALAKELLTDEEYAAIQETKPSGTKAKAILSPVEYQMLQKDAEYNKVTIRLPEED